MTALLGEVDKHDGSDLLGEVNKHDGTAMGIYKHDRSVRGI